MAKLSLLSRCPSYIINLLHKTFTKLSLYFGMSFVFLFRIHFHRSILHAIVTKLWVLASFPVSHMKHTLLLLLLLLLFIAIGSSLGGSSPYTSTDKTYKNKYT